MYQVASSWNSITPSEFESERSSLEPLEQSEWAAESEFESEPSSCDLGCGLLGAAAFAVAETVWRLASTQVPLADTASDTVSMRFHARAERPLLYAGDPGTDASSTGPTVMALWQRLRCSAGAAGCRGKKRCAASHEVAGRLAVCFWLNTVGRRTSVRMCLIGGRITDHHWISSESS